MPWIEDDHTGEPINIDDHREDEGIDEDIHLGFADASSPRTTATGTTN